MVNILVLEQGSGTASGYLGGYVKEGTLWKNVGVGGKSDDYAGYFEGDVKVKGDTNIEGDVEVKGDLDVGGIISGGGLSTDYNKVRIRDSFEVGDLSNASIFTVEGIINSPGINAYLDTFKACYRFSWNTRCKYLLIRNTHGSSGAAKCYPITDDWDERIIPFYQEIEPTQRRICLSGVYSGYHGPGECEWNIALIGCDKKLTEADVNFEEIIDQEDGRFTCAQWDCPVLDKSEFTQLQYSQLVTTNIPGPLGSNLVIPREFVP
jgi:hypothetical protein